MDAVIAQTPSTIHVLPHTQYNAPDALTPSSVLPSPLDQFHLWFAEAVAHPVSEPEAMSLSTATPAGLPSARISQELAANPHCALVFYWREMARSVRVVGRAERVSREESHAYFTSRPAGSRLGAWASRQSSVVAEGEVHARLEKVRARFGASEDAPDPEIPLPEFWGGWRVVPTYNSGPAALALHDRVRYTRQTPAPDSAPDAEPEWTIERLAP
ncbi:pyridoxamine 5'-phosphate oxidase [Mycena olivaceomarginata]|nr:pyridoxamine 5'-phosphate oxidase [Mycena olivaceomarginata]